MNLRWLPVLVLALCACSSATTGGSVDAAVDVTADAAVDVTADVAPAPDGAATGACNDITNDAPEYTQMNVPGPMPTPMGGAVVDGTYFATGEIYYDRTGAVATNRITARVTGATVDLVFRGSTAVEVRARLSIRADPSGRLDATIVCPAIFSNPPDGYTASGNTLTLYTSRNRSALVLTRQ